METKRFNIFIVDDDPDVVETVKETIHTIQEAIFSITVCDNGHTAYIKAKELFPDLILMDVTMPRWDGFQAYEKLQDNESTAKIPVLFLTAANRKEDLQRAVKLKIKHYLAKPFDTETLVKKIREILQF
jgi:CheY-like chemotaxis protein